MDNTLQSYEAAFAELKQIEQAISNDDVPVDELAAKVKRASLLIAFCQQQLTATETEVNNIIKQMEGS